MAQLKATTVNGNITVKGTSRLEGNVTVTGTGGTGKGTIDANMSATNINSGTLSNDRLNKASTSAQGIVQLNDATNSTATTQAATANAVKKAYDRAETKEPAFSKSTAFNKNFETSTGTLKAPGTAAVGTSNNVPRADHVHPAQTTVSGNAGSATKLATGRKIGDATFDGTANITMSSILGNISTGSSGNGGGTRYCKIASVDVSSGTYNNCVGRMFVTSAESNGFNGILYFYFRTGTANTSVSCSLRWESINNNTYSNSIIAVKTADGKFDLYITSKNTYETFQIFVVAAAKEKITLHGGQAFSTTQPTATYTSGLQAQASHLNGFSDTNANTANTIVRRDGSGNFSAGTVTANLSGNSSSSTKLQTARTINGTNFDGTANITTANWGTARTISLGGNASGSVSVNGSANVTLSATVNHSAQAAKLQTARAINGTNFDGTADITTAKWGTARTISLGGDLTGSVSVDGSANVTLSGQVVDDSHNHSQLTSKESTIYLRDHGNGNVTLSAGKNGSGTIGDLYIGYNSSTSYVTTNVRLCRPMNWNGGHTIVDSNGKVPWSTLTGLPSSFTPSSHTHDDRYYTESESNSRFLYRSADSTLTGKIIESGTDRTSGMYGTYDSTKIAHIWSMGTAYKIEGAGANFGNLYGLAYKHTNNGTGGAMASGHQAVWCSNGSPKVALGDNLWAAGSLLASGATISGSATISSNLTVSGTVYGGTLRIKDRSTRLGYDADSTDTYICNEGGNWLRMKQSKTMTYAGYNVQLSHWGTGNPSNSDGRPDGTVYYKYV